MGKKEKNNKVEDGQEEGVPLCPECGSQMIEENGEIICSKCDSEIDFFGDDKKE